MNTPIVGELAKWETRRWLTHNYTYWQFMTFDGLARFCVMYIQWTYLYRLFVDTYRWSTSYSWNSQYTAYGLLSSDTFAAFML